MFVKLLTFWFYSYVDTFEYCYINYSIDEDRELKIKHLAYGHSNQNQKKEMEKFTGLGRIIPKTSYNAYFLSSKVYPMFILFNHVGIFMKETCKF